MKFRNGMWLFREDVRVEFAEDVRTITEGPDGSLSLLCPTRKILNRGNTLNQPTVTIVSRMAAKVLEKRARAHYIHTRTSNQHSMA